MDHGELKKYIMIAYTQKPLYIIHLSDHLTTYCTRNGDLS